MILSKFTNRDSFLEYSLDLIKHLDKLVLQREKPMIIALIFDIVFGWRVEFEKISYQTTHNTKVIFSDKEQKNSSFEEFFLNL